MATTNIHPITSTVDLAIKYIKRDKFELKDDKIVRSKTLTTFMNCTGSNDYQVFCKQRQYYIDSGRAVRGRSDGKENLAFHLVQSFDKKVKPEIANEIGRRLAEEVLSDYSCVISTHTNSDFTHNHFVFNAYKMDGSGKWDDCDATVNKIRNITDRLCEEYGLNVIEGHRDYKPFHWVDKNGRRRTYEPSARKQQLREQHISTDLRGYDMIEKKIERAVKKDISFNEIIRDDIDNAVKKVNNYEELIDLLTRQGYKIRARKKDGGWLKYTSFLCPDGERPIRDASLGAEYGRAKLSALITKMQIDRNLASLSPIPLRRYVQEDIDAKSLGILDPGFMDLNKAEQAEYLAGCINANLDALNTIDKYKYLTYSDFENRLESVSKRFDVLDSQLQDIQKSMLKLTGMSSILRFYNTMNPEIFRMQRKYGLLHGFYSANFNFIKTIKRIDEQSDKLFTAEIKKAEILALQRLKSIEEGRISLSSIIHDMTNTTGIEYPEVTQLTTIKQMKKIPDYRAAKAGDVDAAIRYADHLLSNKEYKRKIMNILKNCQDAILVGIHAEEESGHNKIPLVLADMIGEITGIQCEYGIVQSNRVGHTNSNAIYRFANRAKFEGPVESGRKYILVDDVITSGGSLEELRHYIESKGGKVEHFLTVAAAQYSTNIEMSNQTRFELESRYGIMPLKAFLKEYDIYGGNIDYLTESEGRTILRAGSLDDARKRIAEERGKGSAQKSSRVYAQEMRT